MLAWLLNVLLHLTKLRCSKTGGRRYLGFGELLGWQSPLGHGVIPSTGAARCKIWFGDLLVICFNLKAAAYAADPKGVAWS